MCVRPITWMCWFLSFIETTFATTKPRVNCNLIGIVGALCDRHARLLS